MSPAVSNPSARIPPRIHSSTRFPMWSRMAMGIALLTGAGVLYWFNPTQSRFYPFCLFHQTTGLLCPGCGSLRALHHLLHGHLLTALRCNGVLVLSLPLGAAWAWRAWRGRARGRSADLSAAWLWTGLVVMVLFGVVRNLPFAPATWLAP